MDLNLIEGIGSMAAALFAGWLEWRIVHRAIRFARSEKAGETQR